MCTTKPRLLHGCWRIKLRSPQAYVTSTLWTGLSLQPLPSVCETASFFVALPVLESLCQPDWRWICDNHPVSAFQSVYDVKYMLDIHDTYVEVRVKLLGVGSFHESHGGRIQDGQGWQLGLWPAKPSCWPSWALFWLSGGIVIKVRTPCTILEITDMRYIYFRKMLIFSLMYCSLLCVLALTFSFSKFLAADYQPRARVCPRVNPAWISTMC